MPPETPIVEPKWRRLPAARPQQILDAALQEFGERGLTDARLEDIAKRAGVSKGTIYLYFPNKEELFRDVVRQSVVGRIEQAEHAVRRGSHAAQLRAYATEFWELLRSPAFVTIVRLVHAELHHFPDLAEFYSREVVQRGSALICDIIEPGVKSGEFRRVDPLVAGRMLCATLVTHSIWCSRRPYFHLVADKTDGEVLDEVLDFYFHALRSRPAARVRSVARRT